MILKRHAMLLSASTLIGAASSLRHHGKHLRRRFIAGCGFPCAFGFSVISRPPDFFGYFLFFVIARCIGLLIGSSCAGGPPLMSPLSTCFMPFPLLTQGLLDLNYLLSPMDAIHRYRLSLSSRSPAVRQQFHMISAYHLDFTPENEDKSEGELFDCHISIDEGEVSSSNIVRFRTTDSWMN